jgi:hypothetical protein
VEAEVRVGAVVGVEVEGAAPRAAAEVVAAQAAERSSRGSRAPVAVAEVVAEGAKGVVEGKPGTVGAEATVATAEVRSN